MNAQFMFARAVRATVNTVVRRSAARTIASAAILATVSFATSAALGNVVVGVLLDPATTAGGGATSTRSGLGCYHIYAVDTGTTSYGISSYNLTLGANVTASGNRSPVMTIQELNSGAFYHAGFDVNRSASNAAAMTGSQHAPDPFTFLYKGIGQTTGNFGAFAAIYILGPTTSGSWGGPYPNLVSLGMNDMGGRKWVFLGEGTYDPAGSTSDPRSIVAAAAFTVYGSANDFSTVSAATQIVRLVPEPSAVLLWGVAISVLLACRRRHAA